MLPDVLSLWAVVTTHSLTHHSTVEQCASSRAARACTGVTAVALCRWIGAEHECFWGCTELYPLWNLDHTCIDMALL